MSDDGTPSRLARLLFGGAVGPMVAQNFLDMEGMIEYAESKDVPMADLLVPFASGMGVFGTLGVVFWRLPRLSAGAVATFLAGITPTMHDFWNVEDEERRQQEQFHFFKNLGLLAAALAFISHANAPSESDDSGGGDAPDDPDDDDQGGAVDLDLTDDATAVDDGGEPVTAD